MAKLSFHDCPRNAVRTGFAFQGWHPLTWIWSSPASIQL